MTLILSLAAPPFVVQAADRLLTNLVDRRPVNTNAGKTVLFKNRMVFSFTGIAEILGQPTDQWLRNVLRSLPDMSLSDVLEHVRARATADVARLRDEREYRHLTFVGVGYSYNGTDFIPMICRLSNARGKRGQRLRVPEDKFTLACRRYGIPGSPRYTWLDSGYPMLESEIRRLSRNIRRCARRDCNAWSVARLFVEQIRSVADRSQVVGRDVLVSIIPRSAADQETGVIMHPGRRVGGVFGVDVSKPIPTGTEMHFAFVPDGVSFWSHCRSDQYGPIVVWDGGSMSNISWKPRKK
mgnify:CR=1 FL=1